VKDLRCISEGESLGSLEVMHTPGHTPGSISLWSADEKAIFCGDNVFIVLNGVRMGLPWFTLDLPKRNLCVARYAELKPEMLLSGHGPAYQRDCLTDDLLQLASRFKKNGLSD
jgi:glyoxylase-like metal-dependent hydrolase (beta-lactamase superfamily II)